MLISHKATSVALATLSMPFTGAQLTAYNDDRCSKDSDMSVAFSTFSSNLTSDGPLMWTLTTHSDKDPQKSKLERYWRELTISTPTTLDLSTVTDTWGCGIQFMNVTAALQIPEDFNDYSSFSCNTVLSNECQADLMQQALDDVNLLSNDSESDSSLYLSCGTLANRFQDRPVPQSCNLSTQQPTWGYTNGLYVAGQGFVDRNVSAPNERCYVNNDTAHNDLFVGGGYVSLNPGGEEAKAFQNGTTPLLTIFFNSENSTRLVAPEMHLSCLKTIPTEKEQAQINSAAGRSSILLASLLMSLLAVGIIDGA